MFVVYPACIYGACVAEASRVCVDANMVTSAKVRHVQI